MWKQLIKTNIIFRLYQEFLIFGLIAGFFLLLLNLQSHNGDLDRSSLLGSILLHLPVIIFSVIIIFIEQRIYSVRKSYGLSYWKSYRKIFNKYEIDLFDGDDRSNLIKLGNHSKLNPRTKNEEPTLLDKHSEAIDKYDELYRDWRTKEISEHKFDKECDIIFSDIKIG